jgi:hypothetical protein
MVARTLRGPECVRARELGNCDADGGIAVGVGVHAVVARTELHPRDVAQPRDPAVVACVDDDALELCGVLEAAERVHGELERRAGRSGRLPDGSRRDLDVLLAERGNHVSCRQTELGNPLRVQPHAHAVLARTEQADIADTVDAREHVANPEQCVVAEIQRVATAVRRDQVHGQEDVGRALARGDAGAAYVLGESRFRHGDSVLHEHLGSVQIRPERERDGDGDVAVVGALRGHVGHVLYSVDLLLEGRCDRGRDHFGVRARIARVHHDGGRHDLRVLRHRQRRVGDRADDHDHDGQDRGEDRAIDEEAREAHARGSLVALAALMGGSGPSASSKCAGRLPTACGWMLLPGRMDWSPRTTTRSSGARPARITRSPLITGPA